MVNMNLRILELIKNTKEKYWWFEPLIIFYRLEIVCGIDR
jgi:hypothetical protein